MGRAEPTANSSNQSLTLTDHLTQGALQVCKNSLGGMESPFKLQDQGFP